MLHFMFFWWDYILYYTSVSIHHYDIFKLWVTICLSVAQLSSSLLLYLYSLILLSYRLYELLCTYKWIIVENLFEAIIAYKMSFLKLLTYSHCMRFVTDKRESGLDHPVIVLYLQVGGKCMDSWHNYSY